MVKERTAGREALILVMLVEHSQETVLEPNDTLTWVDVVDLVFLNLVPTGTTYTI